jgi:hypothetical protein
MVFRSVSLTTISVMLLSACGGIREAELPDPNNFSAVMGVAEQLSHDGDPSEAVLFQGWAMRERIVLNGLAEDPTPDSAPSTVAEAIEEERRFQAGRAAEWEAERDRFRAAQRNNSQ